MAQFVFGRMGGRLRDVRLEGVRNVRDLGGIATRDGRVVKPGLLFRGSALNHPSESDIEVLERQLELRRIVDLRVSWELEAKPDAEIPNVRYLHIPLFDQEIVGIDYVKPLPGTRMIGHDFACNSLDFYATMANPLTVAQLAKVLNSIFESALAGEAVYFHCSGGKDRAGITALLVLFVLGVGEEEILVDYLRTNRSRDAHIQPVYERFLQLCYGDEAFAREVTDAHRALPENLDAFYAEVGRLYGGMDDFMRNQLGISDATRDAYREALTV